MSLLSLRLSFVYSIVCSYVSLCKTWCSHRLPLSLHETISAMKRVLLRFTDGREAILEIDIDKETAEIKYGWPAQTFLATEETKNGLDVYEEEQTVDV
jgi:hypothetical protein